MNAIESREQTKRTDQRSARETSSLGIGTTERPTSKLNHHIGEAKHYVFVVRVLDLNSIS
jgi:hypothetical protein